MRRRLQGWHPFRDFLCDFRVFNAGVTSLLCDRSGIGAWSHWYCPMKVLGVKGRGWQPADEGYEYDRAQTPPKV